MRWCDPGASFMSKPFSTTSSVLPRGATMHTVVSSLGESGMGPMLACRSEPLEPEEDDEPLEHPATRATARTGRVRVKLMRRP